MPMLFPTSHAEIPRSPRDWQHCDRQAYPDNAIARTALQTVIQQGMQSGRWAWPERMAYFVTDPHADAAALLRSLAMADLVRLTGPGPLDFQLTPAGREGRLIIGGDCLDKGPSNLDLLRSLRRLLDLGADLVLLAGNHDLRFLLGLMALDKGPEHPDHGFFLRMCPKALPLLAEVLAQYPAAAPDLDEAGCRRHLLPSTNWYARFPAIAGPLLGPARLHKELRRLHDKHQGIAAACRAHGLDGRRLYAAARRCRDLFCRPDGEFAWFFKRMQAMHREGSFLFVHAGMDDRVAERLERQGISAFNRAFRAALQDDALGFYFGPLANVLRTKYREGDWPLSADGVDTLRDLGIQALVHGHNNRHHGQRLAVRAGLLHIECDVTLDRNSRHREGLPGPGAGVTLFCPDGQVIGLSGDHPEAKVLDPYALMVRAPGVDGRLSVCYR